MKKKSHKPLPKPTLITGELIEVTDPTEWAELERRVRAAEKAMMAADPEYRREKALRRKRASS